MPNHVYHTIKATTDKGRKVLKEIFVLEYQKPGSLCKRNLIMQTKKDNCGSEFTASEI